ncbi:MAG: S-methyl-5-thioribose-1-phosphate isomerase [Bacteroidota bacterium]
MKTSPEINQTIWLSKESDKVVCIIDQRSLPHQMKIAELRYVDDAARAIREMWVRGAPLIGVTAAFGVYLACIEALDAQNPDRHIAEAREKLFSTRPTAVNLGWALDRMLNLIAPISDPRQKCKAALAEAQIIKTEDIEVCRMIGHWGKPLIEQIAKQKNGEPVNILTHCNAGWLACVQWGTATSPIYQAFNDGINVHVWVDETRPRNQGARLTAWELSNAGIPHTVVTDNVGGHLMQHGMVDMCIVGTDRTTYTGDVANKIGTYLKALAAKDNDIPFYVALPSSTIDWAIKDGLTGIPVEERGQNEVLFVKGWSEGKLREVRITPPSSTAVNYGFDVTPARLVTKLITERGICDASEAGIKALFR